MLGYLLDSQSSSFAVNKCYLSHPYDLRPQDWLFVFLLRSRPYVVWSDFSAVSELSFAVR